MLKNFKNILFFKTLFLLNFNTFSKQNILCPCLLCCKDKDKDEVPKEIKEYLKEVDEKNKKIKEENDKKKKDEDDKKDDKDLNKDKDLEKNKIKEFKEKFDKFKNDLDEESKKLFKNIDKEDEYFKVLNKYLEKNKIDFNTAKFKIESTKLAHKCLKFTINNSDVVYIKEDNIKNKFYLALLKSSDLCDLYYIYADNVLLTKAIENHVNFEDCLGKDYINQAFDIIKKTKNIYSYFTILGFLGCQDCGTLKLDNNCFIKINDDEYLIKALDISIYGSHSETYYDFYDVLDYGFEPFRGIDYERFLKILHDEKDKLNEDFKHFLHFCFRNCDNLIEINKKNICDSQIFDFLYNINKLNYCNLEAYIENKKGIRLSLEKLKGIKEGIDILNDIYENEFKSNFESFFKDFINVVKEEYNDYIGKDVFKGKDNLEKYLNFYKYCTENSIEIYKNEEKKMELHCYFSDNIEKITEEQKKEIKEKFVKMLNFLIYGNKKYYKKQFDNVVENIKEVQKSKLFPFIFGDEIIKNKINELT